MNIKGDMNNEDDVELIRQESVRNLMHLFLQIWLCFMGLLGLVFILDFIFFLDYEDDRFFEFGEGYFGESKFLYLTEALLLGFYFLFVALCRIFIKNKRALSLIYISSFVFVLYKIVDTFILYRDF